MQGEEEQMQDHDPQGAFNPHAKLGRLATLRQVSMLLITI